MMLINMVPIKVITKILLTAVLLFSVAHLNALDNSLFSAKKRALNGLTFTAGNISFNYITNTLIATNSVTISGSEINIIADTVYYDSKNKLIIAKGNVVYTNAANDTINLNYLELDQETSNFLMQSIYSKFEGGASMLASGITKTTPHHYTVTEVSYTACKITDNTSPTWDVTASSGSYNDKNSTITLYNAIFRIKSIPILWLPIIQFSNISNKRKAGFLIPDFKLSSDIAKIVLPLYIPINESNEITIDTYLTWDLTKNKGFNLVLLNPKYTGYIGATEVQSSGSFSNVSAKANNTWSFFLKSTSYVNNVYRIKTSVEKTNSLKYLNTYDINPKTSSDLFFISNIENEFFLENNYFNLSANNYKNMYTQENYNNIDFKHSYLTSTSAGQIYVTSNVSNFEDAKSTTKRLANDINYSKIHHTSGGQIKYSALLQSTYSDNDKDTQQYRRYYNGFGVATSYSAPIVSSYKGALLLTTPTAQLTYSKILLNQNYKGLIDSTNINYTKNNLFTINHYQGYDNFEQSTALKYGIESRLNDNNVDSVSLFLGQLINLNSNTTDLTKAQIKKSNYFSSISINNKYLRGYFDGLFDLKLKLLSSIASTNIGHSNFNFNLSHIFYQNLNKEIFGVGTQNELNLSINITPIKNLSLSAQTSYGIYTVSQAMKANSRKFELKSLSYALNWQDNCGCLLVNFKVTRELYQQNNLTKYSLVIRIKKF